LMSLLLDLMALLQHGTLDCETKKEMMSIRWSKPRETK
jgi:hypothetical protein